MTNSQTSDHVQEIQRLNEAFMTNGRSRRTIFCTGGLEALGDLALELIFETVRSQLEFDPEYESYGEHDFGQVQ